MNGLKDRGVGFRSLRESLDTTTPGGKLVFHVFASIAEFERDVIRERTIAGLEAARARGRKGGRKPTTDEKKIALALRLMSDRRLPIAEVCGAVGVSRSTLYPATSRRTVGGGRDEGHAAGGPDAGGASRVETAVPPPRQAWMRRSLRILSSHKLYLRSV